jgi:hypothetical protein
MVDLDLRWDADAWKASESSRPVADSNGRFDLEDYFNFLSDVEPARGALTQPAELFKERFTFK